MPRGATTWPAFLHIEGAPTPFDVVQLSQHFEHIYVPVMPGTREADPDWEGEDVNHHRHQAATLNESAPWVLLRRYWCEDCRDEHEDYERRCAICGVVVVQGTRPAKDISMPGPESLELEVLDPEGWFLNRSTEVVVGEVVDRDGAALRLRGSVVSWRDGTVKLAAGRVS